MPNNLFNAWYWIRSSLWFVPCLTILGTFLLSWATLNLDQAISNGNMGSLHGIYAGGPEGARSLLSAVAGSMITVAGVIFSITIVALSQASSQFGPRLLRNFMRDVGNQLVMGVFISTFVYCLLILRTIRSQGDQDFPFVPQLSISIGVLLSLVSIGFLIYFIHHVSRSIQVDDVIAKVVAETRSGDGIHPMEKVGVAWDPGPSQVALPDEEGGVWHASRSGYIQSLDAGGIFGFAAKHDLVIEVRFRPGDFVTKEDALIRFWPRKDFSTRAEREMNRFFVLGAHRTPLQDFRYVINLLVEIAVRALSPSINDPFTALTCIDRLEELLNPLAGKQSPSRNRADAEGRLRLIEHPLTFPELLGTALDPLRLFGSSNPILVGRILEFLKKAVQRSGIPENVAALSIQARLFAREEGWATAADKNRVWEQYQAFFLALAVANRRLGSVSPGMPPVPPS